MFANDPQLPSRGALPSGVGITGWPRDTPSGLEPSLPGAEPAAFDPIWPFVSSRLPSDQPLGLWLEICREVLIPTLRDRRLGGRDDPIRISLTLRERSLAEVLAGQADGETGEAPINPGDSAVALELWADEAAARDTAARPSLRWVWYFNPAASGDQQCLRLPADKRHAVGTQTWPELAVEVWLPRRSHDEPTVATLEIRWRRAGSAPEAFAHLRRWAMRYGQSQWRLTDRRPALRPALQP